MEKERLQFDVFADARAKKKEIWLSIFMFVVSSAFTLLVLFPLDRFGLYSRKRGETFYIDGTPAIVMSLLSAAFFGWIAYLSITQLPRLQNEMNEEPMLYSFNEVGFTSHISGETHEWDDFKTFHYGNGGLYLPYKKKRGTSLVIGPFISRQSYVRIQNHLRRCAPKELSRKV